MNKSIKKEWIRKLRNGKFTQAQETLKESKGRYCCLGVLNTCLPKSERTSVTELYLESKSLKAAGITNRIQQALGKQNDNGKSFEEISNYIEKRL